MGGGDGGGWGVGVFPQDLFDLCFALHKGVRPNGADPDPRLVRGLFRQVCLQETVSVRDERGEGGAEGLIRG